MFSFNFEKLQVWQLGMNLVQKIYKIIIQFPTEERFALCDQLRRATTSIPLNIAEGSGRGTKKDFNRFIRNAIGSTLEVITCLRIARQNNYIHLKQHDEINEIVKELYFKLIGLSKYLER